MLESLGDVGHTTFLTADEWKRMQDGLKGSFEGIGAVIAPRNHRYTVLKTLPHSPAREAGLKVGDVVLRVDGKDVEGLSQEQLVQMVRGRALSKVKLTVQRAGLGYPIDLVITRAHLELPDVTWRMLPGTKVAHIAIREFGEHVDEQLKAAIEKARKEGVRGLILDVRGCPGGLKDQAVAVTSEFLKPGEVVFIEQDGQGRRTEVPVTDKGGAAGDLPVVVLTDEGTASSAEIFAGALQDYGRAKLVGARTIGTGTVLAPLVLSDGSAILLAVDQWLTPKGRQIWHTGIKPDVEVELPPDTPPLQPDDETTLDAAALARSPDKQLREALDLIQKELR
jgi:carboxyl-terminal processing protease